MSCVDPIFGGLNRSLLLGETGLSRSTCKLSSTEKRKRLEVSKVMVDVNAWRVRIVGLDIDVCLFAQLQLPSFIDWFGWCTWDAFYTDVTAEGVDDGLRR